jgi:acetolactate synthase-1/2/3 large subunit
MARLSGGEALAKQLAREGIRVVFGLPGVQLYGAIAGLRDEPSIRFVTARHEQATTYMADGYARAGGGIGAALVVPGPGLLNAAAGLSTAYSASSPVLMIAGQVPRRSIGRDVGVLHEVNDQMDAIAGVTKWRRRVLEVGEVAGAVRAAVRQLRTGRPRPVHIEIPPDVLEEEADVALLPPAEGDRAGAPEPAIARAVELLLAAQRPVIYAGGGAVLSGAHEALVAIAEHLQAGIATTA